MVLIPNIYLKSGTNHNDGTNSKDGTNIKDGNNFTIDTDHKECIKDLYQVLLGANVGQQNVKESRSRCFL